MAENIEVLQKATKFLPLANNLKKLIQVKKLCRNFQPSIVIIKNEGSVNSGYKNCPVISLPYFEKVASSCGINTKYISLPKEFNKFQVLDSIKKLNSDPKVHGIYVELPDYSFDFQTIFDVILPNKDITGLNKRNIENIHLNDDEEILPCTAVAVIEILNAQGTSLENTNILVLEDENSSFPITKALLYKKALVTVSQNSEILPKEVSSADVVINTRANLSLLDKPMKPGAILIESASLNNDTKNDESVSVHVSSEHFLKLTAAIAAKNVFVAGLKISEFKWNLTHIPLNFGFPGLSDIEIARSQILKNVTTLAQEIGLYPHEIELYGERKAKVSLSVLERCKYRAPGKYVVVSGITPTPLGEGKSTTTVGLCQALAVQLKKNVIACLRQPSQGPTFGIKGGAAGGGYSQVVPMEDFNLHLTGDIHAVTAANNLLAAQIDTRMFHEATQKDQDLYRRLVKSEKGKKQFSKIQVNRLQRLGITKTDPATLSQEEISEFVRLDIDPNSITWHRVMDTNDRFLRKITVGQAATEKNMSRETQFDISVASEIMAILALTSDMADMKQKLSNIVVANDRKGNPVLADDLGITGALAVLLKDTLLPNLMQTLEGAPVFVHAGPFANIAHGNSSIIADKMALKLVGKEGFVVTEAGFGADIGLEKFCDIKCRYSGLTPNVAVIVATVRALKLHGGGPNITAGVSLPKEYTEENLPLLEKGYCNLSRHIRIAKMFGLPVVVALNKFNTDTDAELKLVKNLAEKDGVFACVICSHFSEGSKGAKDLAEAVVAASDAQNDFRYLYDVKSPIKEKIEIIAKEIYGASGVEFSDQASTMIQLFEKQGFGNLPICMAKTPLSLSHDPSKKGVPIDFTVPIQDIKLSAGAGFIYPLLGAISTMPGLPTRPCFFDMDIDPETGDIEGLF